MRLFFCLLAVAVVLGVVAGLLTRSESEAAYRLRVTMYPPIGYDGEKAHLHCKYHGACGSSSGYGLDWDNWTRKNDRRVRWRSYIINNTGISLAFIISPNYRDGFGCDYFKAWLYDQGLGYGNGSMKYYHANTSKSGTTYYPSNQWSSPYYIGNMSYDSDCMGSGWAWSGYHIHEMDLGSWVIYHNEDKYDGGYYGDYCSPTHTGSDNCLKIGNHTTSYKTRRFQW